jgi:hypothetical protein
MPNHRYKAGVKRKGFKQMGHPRKGGVIGKKGAGAAVSFSTRSTHGNLLAVFLPS